MYLCHNLVMNLSSSLKMRSVTPISIKGFKFVRFEDENLLIIHTQSIVSKVLQYLDVNL